MPKYFYILYFTSTTTAFVEYLLNAASEIFDDSSVEATTVGKYTKMTVTSLSPIYPWEISDLESHFGEFIGEIIFSHNNATAHGAEVASMEEVGVQHVLSVCAVLNFTFWDIITLKRFFYVRNLRKIVLNSSDIAGFYYYDNLLCFFLQSDKPILVPEVDFYIKTINPVSSVFFKTEI